MSNLSEMLSKPMTDLEDPIIPVGTWKAKIGGGKLGEVTTSKASGNEYQRASVALKLVEPGHDVDTAETGDGKFVGETVFFEQYIMKDADARQLLRTLKAVGAEFDLTGTTEEIIANAIRSAKGLEVYAEVTQEMYENKAKSRVKKIYALAA